MSLDPISWALVVGIIAAEIGLPLALVFWLGRRFERRQTARALSREAEAWLEERVSGDVRPVGEGS